MKPFNLEAALRGEKVVTRDGREVTQLTFFNAENPESLIGVIDRSIYRWYRSGLYFDGITPANKDLFMAPQKREGWVNIYPRDDSSDSYTANASDVHASKEIADANCNPDRRLACIRIEWED